MVVKPSTEVGMRHGALSTDVEDLTLVVARNLKRIRLRKGLSLERLSRKSGVSRAMLGKVELGQSSPTINVLGKIARALEVTCASLIGPGPTDTAFIFRAQEMKRLTSPDRHFSLRALFPANLPRNVEFYELELGGYTEETEQFQRPGTFENLVVNTGTLEVETSGRCHKLGTGDGMFFPADCPHTYRNRGTTTALIYLVRIFADTLG